MKKNDLFIDVSSHNGYDITGILADMGTQNTIIKVSESTNYLNLACLLKLSNPHQLDSIILLGLVVTLKKLREARYFLDNVPQK